MWIPKAVWEEAICSRAELAAKVQLLTTEWERSLSAWERERERADRAVDELLRQSGVAPVTPPTKPEQTPDMFEEDHDEVKAIQARIEELGAGAVLMETTNG